MKITDAYSKVWLDIIRQPTIKKSLYWANSQNEGRTKEFLKRFKDLKNLKILELGGGAGNFGTRLLNNPEINIKTYTFADHQRTLSFISDKTLKDLRVKTVRAHQIEKLRINKFDVVVSINCLSETTTIFREYLYKNIFPNCKNLFVIDGGKEFKEEFKIKLNEIFTNVQILPWEERPGRKLYIASN